MSTRKLLIAALKTGVPATYDDLLQATGASRHNLSNALNVICAEGIVEKVPATFLIGDVGREKLKQAAKAKAAAALQTRLDDAARRRDNRRKARIAALATPAKLHASVPNSVFDMARVALPVRAEGVAA
jgi:hypothetical protein